MSRAKSKSSPAVVNRSSWDEKEQLRGCPCWPTHQKQSTRFLSTNSPLAPPHFAVIARCWAVERTLVWLTTHRRGRSATCEGHPARSVFDRWPAWRAAAGELLAAVFPPAPQPNRAHSIARAIGHVTISSGSSCFGSCSPGNCAHRSHKLGLHTAFDTSVSRRPCERRPARRHRLGASRHQGLGARAVSQL